MFKPIALLMSGTALAQVVPILLSPVLTRIYSPEAFGVFAWAVSIVTVATLLVSGAYDQAVNLPKERSEAIALVVGMLSLGAAAGCLLGIAAVIEWLARGHSQVRLWFVPCATFLTVAFTALSAWANREARFELLVRARIALALTGVAVTLLLGVFGWTASGLLAGNLAGLAAGCTLLWFAIKRADAPLITATSYASVGTAFREHRRCPIYLLPSSLLNTITNQLPVWFLGRLFGPATVGQYALMNRVLNVPVSLTSASVGDVFKQRIAAEYRDTGQCRTTFLAFARGLGLATVAPAIVVIAAGPALFSWVFGDAWRDAGRYAQIMGVLFACRFAISPLTYVVIVARKARLDLILQSLCLCAALAAWAVGSATGSADYALATFALLYSIVYLIYLGFSYRLACRS